MKGKERSGAADFLREVLCALGPRDHRRLLAVFCIGVALMFLLISAVSLIPNAWIGANVQDGMDILAGEGFEQWTPILAYGQGDKLDNGTERIILTTLLQNEETSVFQRAMEGGVETRYWQGYRVLLRPLFIVFSYVDLRAVMYMVLSGLIILCMVRTQARFGGGTAAGLGAALVLGHTIIVPWNFQFIEVFWIALAAMAFVLRRYRAQSSRTGDLAVLFLIIGMATQYFDFLTAPALTLCLPLAVVLLADLQAAELPLGRRWAHFFWPSAAWAVGWVGGWASKWPLAAWLLQRDVVGDALHQMTVRSALGDGTSRPNALNALVRNVFCFLPMSQLRTHGNMRLFLVFVALYAVLLALALGALLRRRPARARWAAALPALACAAIPYLWFIVLAGHTEEHYGFAFRSQIASAFVLCGVWLALYKNDLPAAASLPETAPSPAEK